MQSIRLQVNVGMHKVPIIICTFGDAKYRSYSIYKFLATTLVCTEIGLDYSTHIDEIKVVVLLIGKY